MLFPHLPDSSRVWAYQSQTKIAADVQEAIKAKLNVFVQGWAAHGNELFGAAEIVDDYFIVLAVDESKVPASGCSIDTSVHFIRQIGKDYQLDFFNRLNILIIENGIPKIIHFNDISTHTDSIVYNPLIQSLGELRNSWKVKVSDSQFV